MDDRLAGSLIEASKHLTEVLEGTRFIENNITSKEIREAATYAVGVMDSVAAQLLEETPYVEETEVNK